MRGGSARRAHPPAELDLALLKEHRRGRNLLQHEATDGIPLSQGENFARGLEANLGGAPAGRGMPGGAKHHDIRASTAIDALDDGRIAEQGFRTPIRPNNLIDVSGYFVDAGRGDRSRTVDR